MKTLDYETFSYPEYRTFIPEGFYLMPARNAENTHDCYLIFNRGNFVIATYNKSRAQEYCDHRNAGLDHEAAVRRCINKA